jgi:hypothetical protein
MKQCGKCVKAFMHMFTLPSPNLLHSLNDSPINTIEDIPGKSQTKRNNQIGNTKYILHFQAQLQHTITTKKGT